MDKNAIWLYRNGRFLTDYGLGRSTEQDLGKALTSALMLARPGDELITGPFRAAVINATLPANKVKLTCHGTTLVPAGNHTHLFKAAGTDCVIRGLCADGLTKPNIGKGYGIWITGDRTQLVGCTANSNRGTKHTNGDGSCLKVDGATDVLVEDFRSDDAMYASVWLNGCNRVVIRGAYITNPYRAFSINSASNLDWMAISNVQGVATKLGSSVLLNTNIDDGVALGELKLTNVSLVDTDMVAPGVSYSHGEGHQMAKVQNTKKIIFDKVNLEHGTNAGSGIVRTLYVQEYKGNQAPEEFIIRDSAFSDCLLFSLKLPYLSMEGTHVGRRSLRNYASAFRPKIGLGRFIGNTIRVHKNRFVLTPDINLDAKDHLEFRYNRFEADAEATVYVHKLYPQGEISVDKTNQLINHGTGGFEVSP
jgi:hypothetical protein